MTKARKIVLGSVIAAVTLLLVIGGLYDKTIARNFYQKDNFGAQLFESAGIFPPFIFLGATFAVLFFLVRSKDKYCILKKLICIAVVAGTYLVYGYVASMTFLTRFWAKALTAVITAGVLSPLTFLFFRKMRRERQRRYAIFLLFATIVCVVSTLITANAMKFIWGRVRYREMLAEGDRVFAQFTPWYKINGFSLHGHHSFPSAHTSAATNLLVLFALDEVFPESAKKKKTVVFVVSLYIFTMAYSRIVLGAHFLSDVTVGFLIGYLTYLVARVLYFDKSRSVGEALIKVNEMAAAEAKQQELETAFGTDANDAEADIEVMEQEIDAGLLLYKGVDELCDEEEEEDLSVLQEEEDDLTEEAEPDEMEQEIDAGLLLYSGSQEIYDDGKINPFEEEEEEPDDEEEEEDED